jgi:hypothetical protein
MADDHWSPTYPIPERHIPSELLFEFVRVSDQAPMSCEVRFHGESYGWEARILERGELQVSHGAFTTKAAAIRWAEKMRTAMESPSWMEPLPPVPIP